MRTAFRQGIADFNATFDLALWSHASAEAQVAAIADDIAYDAHDLDDGLRAYLFELSDLSGLPVIGGLLREVRDQYPGIEPARLTHELVRRLIGRLIEDVVGESTRRLGATAPTSSDEVRAAGTPMVGFSALMAATDRAIKDFLWTNMYRHERVIGVMEEAEVVVRELFARFFVSAAGHAAGVGRGAAGARRALARAAGRGFHCRNDRSFRFQEHARLFPKTPATL